MKDKKSYQQLEEEIEKLQQIIKNQCKEIEFLKEKMSKMQPISIFPPTFGKTGY